MDVASSCLSTSKYSLNITWSASANSLVPDLTTNGLATYLGVEVTRDLSWSPHVNKISRQADQCKELYYGSCIKHHCKSNFEYCSSVRLGYV